MDKTLTPEDILGELFYDVHRAGLFGDGKLFADSRMKLNPKIILKNYQIEKAQKGFQLKSFIEEYFEIPTIVDKEDSLNQKPIEQHINELWPALRRDPNNKKERSSRITLPHPYIVPGGRFNEIYYWDSYFTMLGLRVSGRTDMIEHMVNNFKHLIETFGHIPNGNRTYFLSRSQPPFYSLMVKLLIDIKGKEIIRHYLPTLVAEYNFWMNGTNEIKQDNAAINRVVKIHKSFLLNRYYDQKDTPREEMYQDDWGMINYQDQKSSALFRELRAACESGWDFSSRWLSNSQDLHTIETTDILPIDLNCLLWHLEQLLSECYNHIGKDEIALNYGILAVNRKKTIGSIFWDEESSFFSDYSISKEKTTGRKSLAASFPLFFGLATQEQANQVAELIKTEFLKDGGVLTTPINSGQQWDAPNGWAPLQYMTIKGLLRYGHKALAQEIASRWIRLNKDVYERTGKMLEKYNVVDTTLEGGGGEYPVQDGFGWTNGVYLALTHL